MNSTLPTGYYWQWIQPLNSYVLKYKSIYGTYSPPILDKNLSWYHIKIPSHKNIKHFELQKKLKEFKCAYIYNRTDINKIEIWSSDLEYAIIKITQYLQSI
jgi:hypothetical protein